MSNKKFWKAGSKLHTYICSMRKCTKNNPTSVAPFEWDGQMGPISHPISHFAWNGQWMGSVKNGWEWMEFFKMDGMGLQMGFCLWNGICGFCSYNLTLFGSLARLEEVALNQVEF